MRLLTADTHPDHDMLIPFRRENQALLTESFVKVLALAPSLKLLEFGQLTVADDGTKVLANASKHSAVSYERAGEMNAQLELEVQQLLAEAAQADARPLQDGLTLPGENTRRQERKAARAERGDKVRGKLPEAPSHTPAPKDQYNFTDPETRIMKAGHGPYFEPTYNAQAAVEVESRRIVGERFSQAPNDK